MNDTLFLVLKRIKTIAIQLSIAVVFFGLNWLSQNITSFELPLWTIGIISYLLAQLTKYWSDQYHLGRTFFGRVK